MTIKDWPADDRPREKLLAKGAAALSDAELLAIVLRTGIRGKSAVELGQDLIHGFGGLPGLFAASPETLDAFKGLGQAKTVQLRAAQEIVRRLLSAELASRDALSSPRAVRDYLRLALQGLEHEVFMALLLDAQNRVIRSEELFRGSLTQTSVYPREVVKLVLRHNAASVIFAHNHPSGVAEPSRSDEALTQALKQSLALVDVKVLDHFIVAGNGCLSFAERGIL
ncbi:MAG TPA: DNA repair protein RadC [Burkholderiales bacterium]|nr:DNA repair protein RadC [Burkholderiales bacterium]